MPCLNEAETLAKCIGHAQTAVAKGGFSAEIIVADNGSTDGSQRIASELGARVVDVSRKGYGSALIGGIDAARGRFVIMGDADDSYDFEAIGPLIDKLREGYDLVVGNRFMGGIEPGAMPWSHRWVGNPVLTFISRIFFHAPVGDTHCGLRAFKKDAYERMRLRATGMEFASEMVIKASLKGMRITEVAVVLRPDGRSRPPHLRTWRDGWRHLRFMLLFSPRWLFLYPGPCICSRWARFSRHFSSGAAARGRRAARHPHAAGGRLPVPARLPARAVRSLHEDLRHPHGLPPSAPGAAASGCSSSSPWRSGARRAH